jgi:hypothetical protein
MAKCGSCKRPIEGGSSERKRKQSSVFIDDYWGKEPSASLEPQYPRTEDKGMGANAWVSSDSSEEPKLKSNQDRPKDIFGDRAE